MLKNRLRVAALSLLLAASALSGCSSGEDGRQDDAPYAAALADQNREAAAPDPSLRKPDASAVPRIDGLAPVLENDSLLLYISKETAEIAVTDKASGQMWRSNPDSAGDQLASPYLKGKLSAQLSFVYLTQSGQNKDYDSFNDSVKHGRFEIKESDRDVSVTYTFGNPDKGLESIPLKVSKERFEERLLARLTDPADQEQLKIRYKFVEEQNVYERREIPKAVVGRLLSLFEKVGYTEEDLAIDNGEGGEGSDPEAAANPKFSATLRYTLDGGDLIASVDAATITEDTPPYRVHSISLLENFGAAGLTDEGYILLPDGSGALIPFNSGNVQAQPILIPIYGEDGAIYVRERFGPIEPSRLPVFGMKKNDAAFLAVIEEGAALARLSADISGRLHEFNTASAQFVILPKDEVRLSNNEIMHKTPQNAYRGELRIRYSFLSGRQADYSGMAARYRSYLERTQGMEKQAPEGEMPFYLELTGSIPKKKNVLGFPYEALVPLTDLNEAGSVVDRLLAGGAKNVRLQYKGWFNGGLNHKLAYGIDMDGVVGSRGEWARLADKLKESGGGFYPDAAFLRVYDDSASFRPTKDAAQHISRRYAKIYEFDRAAFFRDNSRLSHYLLAPRKLETVVSGFLRDYGKLNPGAISLRDLGSELYSDFRRNGEVTREDAKNTVTGQLARLAEAAPDMMLSGGNAYSLPYASHIVGVPETSNGYQLAGESVPFLQMVLHGFVDYAGKPYNLADEQDVGMSVLRSLETGASVYFSWFYEEPSALKDTRFSYLYSNHYEAWMEEALTAYGEVNEVLRKTRGRYIERHEKLADGVYRTEYENGLAIIVNYGGEAYSAGGVTVQPNDYYVEGG
ncbi:DUF5696 domain-containing protein [Paenibacillus arenilitoris]|uniref:Lipoprotein n=1 Tax=Paenibacillus arenilitoris TaxID=2772299 RepID=A0A927H718_9BACL|nr:DUF5696 domain-containing protein [Paenibacillus arenilitoris]MBD2870183.1 hypothetical protein [Paenibacillus arenilitoris]